MKVEGEAKPPLLYASEPADPKAVMGSALQDSHLAVRFLGKMRESQPCAAVRLGHAGRGRTPLKTRTGKTPCGIIFKQILRRRQFSLFLKEAGRCGGLGPRRCLRMRERLCQEMT